jgi:hypothetical protein
VGDDNNPSGAFVFMISTRAGGVGLNLIGADTVSVTQVEASQTQFSNLWILVMVSLFKMCI